jgi:threonine dehydrogenase-like Zn-dependent dehydrogenase
MTEETMRVAVMTGVRQIELWELAKPRPYPGEVLIKTKACALCTWEQRTYTGVAKSRFPFAGGHEYSGVIEEIGEDTTTKLKVGDLVTVGASGCGQCYYCRSGEETKCEYRYAPGRVYEGLWGPMGLAEYRIAPVTQIYRHCPDLSFVEAALSEPTACVVHAQRRLGITLGEDVLVIGGGTMGLLNMLVAKARGARVMLSELSAERYQKAKDLGAHDVFNAKEVDVPEAVKKATLRRSAHGAGADVVIVAIGSGAANRQALQAVGPLGRVMMFAAAHPAEDLCVDPNWLHRDQAVITGSVSGDVHGFRVATKLLSDRLIDVKPLIETTMPLDKIKEALELAVRPETYRVVVTM